MNLTKQITRCFLSVLMIFTLSFGMNRTVYAEEIEPLSPVVLNEADPAESGEGEKSENVFMNMVLPIIAIMAISLIGAKALAKKK